MGNRATYLVCWRSPVKFREVAPYASFTDPNWLAGMVMPNRTVVNMVGFLNGFGLAVYVRRIVSSL